MNDSVDPARHVVVGVDYSSM